MVDKVSFELMAPDRLLMAAEVDMAVVPGSAGDFAVMAGHAPMISTLRPGVLEVHEVDGGEVTRIFVRGGFADVARDRLTVLAQEAVPVAELDRGMLDQSIQNAREDVEDAADDASHDAANIILEQLIELREALAN